MRIARWGTGLAAVSFALAPCDMASGPVEVAAGAAPRIALVDTSAHGPVLALDGPTEAGELLVLCSTAVLEFDPHDRSVRERAAIEQVFTSNSGAFLAIDGAPEPWFCVAGMGGVIVQDFSGAVHYRLVPRQVGELSESRTFPSAERGGPEVVVTPDGSQWMSVRFDRSGRFQRVMLPGRGQRPESALERQAMHRGVALRTQLVLEQAPIAGFTGALVRVEARGANGALAWNDELRCDPGRQPFPETVGAIRLVDVDGRTLAVVGCSSGLALYALGASAR